MRKLTITTILTAAALTANIMTVRAQKNTPDSTRHPYARIVECTHIGVPMVLGGILEMDQNKKFRKMRNSYMPDFHCEADNYMQYLPAGVMMGMKAFGVEGRSSWGQMLTADGFSIVAMAALVNGVKYTAKLERPDGSSHNSFPSGHTATAFMTATMLSKEYGDISPWISMAAYTNATATGLMRIANNRHWMSDIMAGAGLGVMSTELGYWISDLIFKKDRSRSELVDLWQNYEPGNPSFFGFYAGFQIPLTNYKPDEGIDLNTYTGSVSGIEGAWFWNHHYGIGGRASASTVYYTEAESVDNDGDTFEMEMYQAGVYGYYSIYKHIYFSPKVLAGANHYNKIDTEYMYCKAKTGACLSAGVSLGVLASPNFDFNLYADWNLLSPNTDSQNGAMQTLGLGARFSYRFTN